MSGRRRTTRRWRARLPTRTPQTLLALDPALSDELLVAGRAPWQVLAGAADGGSWSAAVTYDAAPYGVTYLVATWTRDP